MSTPFERQYVSPKVERALKDIKKQDKLIRKANTNKTAKKAIKHY